MADKQYVKGAADKAKGAVKDSVGSVTGNKKMRAEGKADKAEGAAHNAAGDVKDAGRRSPMPQSGKIRHHERGSNSVAPRTTIWKLWTARC